MSMKPMRRRFNFIVRFAWAINLLLVLLAALIVFLAVQLARLKH